MVGPERKLVDVVSEEWEEERVRPKHMIGCG